MPNAFFVNMHPSLSRGLSEMLHRLDINVYTPNDSFVNWIAGGFTNMSAIELPHTTQVSVNEFDDLPIDYLFICCIEEFLAGFLHKHGAIKRKAHLIHYAGNGLVPYPAGTVKALLYTNEQARSRLQVQGPAQEIRPILPYCDLPHDIDPTFQISPPRIESYIQEYAQTWPRGYRLFQEIQRALPDYAITNIEGLPRSENLARRPGTVATLHLKDEEGYGYTVLESAAMGIPVILSQDLRNKTPGLALGETAVYAEDVSQATTLLHRLVEEPEYRNELGQRQQAKIYSWLDEEAQVDALGRFLEGLS